MKVVSEDNSNSVLSNLLKVVYGEDVFFSNGISGVENVLDALISSYPEEDIVAYVDLVPGNLEVRKTVLSYFGKYKKYSNVYIVPIICSEYCVLLCWIAYGIIKDEKLSSILEGDLWFGSYDKDFSGKSIEGFCKYILFKKLPDVCRRNNNDDTKDIRYYKDSVCKICGTCPNLIKRSVDCIVNHGAYIANSIIDSYYTSIDCDYDEFVRGFLRRYNNMCDLYSEFDKSGVKYKKIRLRD